MRVFNYAIMHNLVTVDEKIIATILSGFKVAALGRICADIFQEIFVTEKNKTKNGKLSY